MGDQLQGKRVNGRDGWTDWWVDNQWQNGWMDRKNGMG